MRETGAKIGSGFRTLFWGPLVLHTFHRPTGSHFWARVLGGGVPPRPSLWSSLLEPSNLDADQKSSARCSQITYMIICGIQSYSLNCSQKEQGGSSSLHVRMYALVLAPCSNCGGPLCKGTFSTGFSGLVGMNPPNRQKLWATQSRRSTGVALLLLRLGNHVGTMNGILGAGHGMAERDAAGCPSKSSPAPAHGY